MTRPGEATAPQSALIFLALETSCDETSAALVRRSRNRFEVLSNVVSSQIPLHRPYGGVVPELASRQHLALVQPVVNRALRAARVSIREIDGVAATYGPGLASSLLIGLTMAKALAVSLRKPFVPVNHLEGHLWSPFLNDKAHMPPHIALIVSGGHTLLVRVSARCRARLLGLTLDDAAGEAFDKVAKLLGLGYPGGPVIDRLAREGNPAAISFPRGLLQSDNWDFSFSGLKTAVLYFVKKLQASNSEPRISKKQLADICASFQEAVVDVLVAKTLRAAQAHRLSLITVSGGVACNSRLRAKMRAQASPLQIRFCEPRFCTDHAAMIAAAAFARLHRASKNDLQRDVEPNARLPEN